MRILLGTAKTLRLVVSVLVSALLIIILSSWLVGIINHQLDKIKQAKDRAKGRITGTIG